MHLRKCTCTVAVSQFCNYTAHYSVNGCAKFYLKMDRWKDQSRKNAILYVLCMTKDASINPNELVTPFFTSKTFPLSLK